MPVPSHVHQSYQVQCLILDLFNCVFKVLDIRIILGLLLFGLSAALVVSAAYLRARKERKTSQVGRFTTPSTLSFLITLITLCNLSTFFTLSTFSTLITLITLSTLSALTTPSLPCVTSVTLQAAVDSLLRLMYEQDRLKASGGSNSGIG